MRVKITAFGIAKDIVGGREIEFSLPDSTTVFELKVRLLEQYPKFESLASLSIALNSEYADEEALIGKNDEIVLIPPVSGG